MKKDHELLNGSENAPSRREFLQRVAGAGLVVAGSLSEKVSLAASASHSLQKARGTKALDGSRPFLIASEIRTPDEEQDFLFLDYIDYMDTQVPVLLPYHAKLPSRGLHTVTVDGYVTNVHSQGLKMTGYFTRDDTMTGGHYLVRHRKKDASMDALQNWRFSHEGPHTIITLQDGSGVVTASSEHSGVSAWITIVQNRNKPLTADQKWLFVPLCE